jgi:hypothetical protein
MSRGKVLKEVQFIQKAARLIGAVGENGPRLNQSEAVGALDD